MMARSCPDPAQSRANASKALEFHTASISLELEKHRQMPGLLLALLSQLCAASCTWRGLSDWLKSRHTTPFTACRYFCLATIRRSADKAKTFKNHWNGILNYVNTRIDDGVLEGINSLIQIAKNSSRGFRSIKI